MKRTAEHQRLHDTQEGIAHWKHWGPYLSERAWGTVREDYSAGGDAWNYLPHDHARSRAYRWNEDGLGGFSDMHSYLCFALALWNGHDPILKERLYGLSGTEGNHGEDVKEYYFYLDSTPTHSYMKLLYKYPQAAYPYAELLQANRARGYHDPEYELRDTGIFNENRYFDVTLEYAKAAPNDILIQIEVANRGTEAATCHVLPTLWFRNTWSWGYPNGPLLDVPSKPNLHQSEHGIHAEHPVIGKYTLFVEGNPALLFTENETNRERLYGVPNESPYVKDAFHRFLINGETSAINPAQTGTKAAAHYALTIPGGASVTLRLRLVHNEPSGEPFAAFDQIVTLRRQEADEFYEQLHPDTLTADEKLVQRQAYAGMLWSKQLYYYDVLQWLKGDPGAPPPPDSRRFGRNAQWTHLNNFDIISMPDKWEYPWYACWDLAFHCIPLVEIDPDFAKEQLLIFTREWFMHPNGQLPAYEWALGDVNPPVHVWATWRVYKIDAKHRGKPDRAFLERIFHKLLLNFTWWVNRKDTDGRDVFSGGFLGLDNISVFDRSAPLPTGGHLDQSDATAWMGFYSLIMLRIALELAQEEPIYQDSATKFFEHFLRIANAVTGTDHSLWDEQDGFFYDVLNTPHSPPIPLRVRSLVGLMALLAVETLEPHVFETMTHFGTGVHWLMQHRPDWTTNVTSIDAPGAEGRRLVSFVSKERLVRILRYMLDENEFLSPYGIRSLSKVHEANPYTFYLDGATFSVNYQPAESQNGLFGGNSNWRGPIWFPINYLLIEALQKYHHFYGDSLRVECPTGSGQMLTLGEVSHELSRRLRSLFLRNESGKRPIYDANSPLQNDPFWRDALLFHEYFHGDTGQGLGANHQTGWTGLVARLFQQAERRD
jgi:hypothetical protein